VYPALAANGSIASILGLVIAGIFTNFGSTLTTLFSSVSTSN
jgi:hypothetical protein